MVPPPYLGVWKRTLLTTRSGVRDTTTQVYWTQAQTLFADLRIPEIPPASTRASLQECTDEELLALASQQAFAGNTDVEGDLATWHRQIDYEPPAKPDVGRITWLSNDVMHEDDPDGGKPPQGAYHETWERVPGTGECWEAALVAADGSGRKGFLLAAGSRFAFAADRATPLPQKPGKLAELVAAAATKEEKVALLGYEASYGSLDGFQIELSTLPGRAGSSLLQEPLSLTEVKSALDGSKALMLGALPPQGGWKKLV